MQTGNVVKTTFTGDDECTDADSELQNAVNDFNFALLNFTSQVGFRTFQVATQSLEVENRIEAGIIGKRAFMQAS